MIFFSPLICSDGSNIWKYLARNPEKWAEDVKRRESCQISSAQWIDNSLSNSQVAKMVQSLKNVNFCFLSSILSWIKPTLEIENVRFLSNLQDSRYLQNSRSPFPPSGVMSNNPMRSLPTLILRKFLRYSSCFRCHQACKSVWTGSNVLSASEKLTQICKTPKTSVKTSFWHS